MRQARQKLLCPTLALCSGLGIPERACVPPEDVVSVFETFPFLLRKQVAEGRVAQRDGLRSVRFDCEGITGVMCCIMLTSYAHISICSSASGQERIVCKTDKVFNVPDAQLVPVHLTFQSTVRVLEEHLVPFRHLRKGSRVRGIVRDLALGVSRLLLAWLNAFPQRCETEPSRRTAFQGARVQLKPGASIITSRL